MNRQEQLDKLKASSGYGVVIIGGGATGLGCAVDAASRGLSTLLLEKHDFSKGTSSRATKLVHGGVRYLAQGNIRLVREALLERGRLLKNAPHVCHTLAFVVPSYRWWQKYWYGIGLRVYEFLSFRLSLGKTGLLSRAKTLDRLPQLSEKNLTGGVLYHDGQFDDSRLAVNLAQTAVEHGATLINYCGVTGLEKQGNKITGVLATDSLTGEQYSIAAKVVINATGVFGDSILQMAEQHAAQTIAPSQGVHLVIDGHFFPGNTALMIPKTDDGRVLFVIPWHDKLILGTTDTPVGEISVEPRPLQEEIDFIIGHFNRYTKATISEQDVRSVFVGLRPLAKVSGQKKTSIMPRDHVVRVLASGLVHVTGGKWTTYRNMAEHAIDEAIKSAGLNSSACKTRQLRIHGGEAASPVEGHLAVYGSDAILIQNLMNDWPELQERIHPGYPYSLAEVQWAVENEMACTVEDVLARRIRLLFLDARAAIDAAPRVAQMMSKHLRYGEYWIQQQVSGFTQLARGYLLSGESSD